MNERIKELALQAKLEMCSCGCDMPTRQIVEFAKLIVKECSGIVLKNTNTHTYHRVSYEINQHFGVE